MVQAREISMYIGHQARYAGFVISPLDLPDITQVGKLKECPDDPFIGDRFLACHSSFNRFLERASM